MSDYPTPTNPFVGREITPELAHEIFEGCKKSWEVDSGWMTGDYFVIWCKTNDRYINDEAAAREFLEENDALDAMRPQELCTAAEVCLAFPGPVRDLTRSHFDHYAGWVLAHYPDQASRKLDQMKASGEYE
jgi:hypothetical protein